MNFDVSRRFKANASQNDIAKFLESSFRKTAQSVLNNDRGILNVESINATFGSINRNDKTTVEIKEKDGDIVLVANVSYNPSGWFWVFFVCGLFTTVGWLIPVIFYFYQKNTVKTAIEEIFNRTETEFRNSSNIATKSSAPVSLDDAAEKIEKLGALMEKGLLSKEEFEAQKAKLLGMA